MMSEKEGKKKKNVLQKNEKAHKKDKENSKTEAQGIFKFNSSNVGLHDRTKAGLVQYVKGIINGRSQYESESESETEDRESLKTKEKGD